MPPANTQAYSVPSIFVIIPTYNRKAITLQCLEYLSGQEKNISLQLVVVDDGSTDGTVSAIHAQYPQVQVLKGDGNLWWAGAIKKGMQYAHKQGASHVIWLYDDTLPAERTLFLLVQACTQDPRKIVSAQCYDSADFQVPTYGGHRKKMFALQYLFVPEGKQIRCDCMSGNLVCIPCSVIDRIGYPLNHKLPQSLADVVYTWEAQKAGYQLEVIGDAKAICKFNPLEQGWLISSTPIIQQWKRLRGPKSNFYPPAYWHYCKSFYGYLALIPFLHVYFKLLVITIIRWILPASVILKVRLYKNKFNALF